MTHRREVEVLTPTDTQSAGWARSILPAPALASRQWSHALARRCREPARVAGFIEPAASAHHIVMATGTGFRFEAREVGTSNWRHYAVEPGELCVVGAGSAANELCWQSHGRARSFEVVELYIDLVALRAKSGFPDRVSLEPCWRVLRDPLVKQLVGSIARELDQPQSDQDLFGDLATTLLAVQLERLHGKSARAQQQRRGGLTPLALQRVREYVAAHLASAIRLQRLATLTGLSPFHFSRAFKASTGLSPQAYVLHCRIAEAKRLLSCTTLAVSDVARRTGFNSPGHLSSRFRASTGTTPSAFRCLLRP